MPLNASLLRAQYLKICDVAVDNGLNIREIELELNE